MPGEGVWVNVRTEHVDEAFPLLMARFKGFALNPGVLSGLALAGANRCTPGDDGVLTAEEVIAMDLSQVDLVVLSACETGLGFDVEASSEGLFGLQRAFHAAGAKTTVATVWTVPDQATRELMERFYANLWSRRMGKSAALREAQLWMLRDRASEDRGSARGLTEIEETPKFAADTRLPPYYWAAFVLSGDWR
jgi:CHAT domain-containing protein